MLEIVRNPNRESWKQLCQRPPHKGALEVERVRSILAQVRREGDSSLFELTHKFDGVALGDFQVSAIEIENAEAKLSPELAQAIRIAWKNIHDFHAAQREEPVRVETSAGVFCWRKSVPIERIGLYIPGGTAPLFSTALMLTVPAYIAGCKEIVVCTPPQKNGEVHPAILFVCKLSQISTIFRVGGAQAIAALAYGTESIPQVNKIFGPGNSYVTTAKQLVQQEGISIDLPAGPSEVAIVADDSACPEFVAADLLAQAEHGADSHVMLVSTSEAMLQAVGQELAKQLELLPRRQIIEAALAGSQTVLLPSLDDCMDFVNMYAPEHLILAVTELEKCSQAVRNAGSVFLGNMSAEAFGDYASGTNHTLPTVGFARSLSGLSLDSFIKKITFQEITERGVQSLGKVVECLAEAEGLDAHKNAVSVRIRSVNNGRD